MGNKTQWGFYVYVWVPFDLDPNVTNELYVSYDLGSLSNWIINLRYKKQVINTKTWNEITSHWYRITGSQGVL